MNTTEITYVKSSQLRAGMVVQDHGCRFKLTTEIKCYRDDVWAWNTELVTPGPVGLIPMSWQKTWTVQANDNVSWRVES